MYENWKSRYENTKPIRGRAVECRPWGERRRDFEQIARVLTPLGEGYTARLYNTDVVTVAPNGDIFIKSDSWATYTTAEWIRYRSPFMSYKKYGRLWVNVADRAIPISSSTVLHIKYNEANNTYSCDKEVVLQQKVVDRSKAKEIRKTITPFKQFAKAIMSLADGWVANETAKQHRIYSEQAIAHYSNYHYIINGEKFERWDLRGSQLSPRLANRILDVMQKFDELSDHDKVGLILMITEGMGSTESRVVETIQRENEWNGQKRIWTENVYEHCFPAKAVVNRIDYIMKKAGDVYTTKEVTVTKPITNLL
jgi:hypothetical protein